jgi:hypothetical protein
MVAFWLGGLPCVAPQHSVGLDAISCVCVWGTQSGWTPSYCVSVASLPKRRVDQPKLSKHTQCIGTLHSHSCVPFSVSMRAPTLDCEVHMQAAILSVRVRVLLVAFVVALGLSGSKRRYGKHNQAVPNLEDIVRMIILNSFVFTQPPITYVSTTLMGATGFLFGVSNQAAHGTRPPTTLRARILMARMILPLVPQHSASRTRRG